MRAGQKEEDGEQHSGNSTAIDAHALGHTVPAALDSTDNGVSPDDAVCLSSHGSADITKLGRLLACFKGTVLDMAPSLSLSTLLASLLRNSVPAALSSILFFAVQNITLMFVGHHLDQKQLSYYVVGVSVVNVTGLSIAVGFAAALDTLCSQAHGRSPNGSPEVGELLQRALFLCFLLCIPLIIFFLYSEPVLVIVFGEDLGAGAAQVLRYSPAYLLASVAASCIQKTLQAQNQSHLPTLAFGAAVAVTPLFNLWLTPKGIGGAVAAVTLITALLLIVMVLIAAFHPKSHIPLAQWPLSKKALLDVQAHKEFLRMAVPSMAAVCSEWWAFEILVFISTALGTLKTDAFNIALYINNVLYTMSCSGIGIGAAVTCGNALGARDAASARAYVRLSLLFVLCCVAFDCAVVLLFRSYIFCLYSNDADILRELRKITPHILLLHLGDCIQNTMQGAFRGVGLQHLSALVSIVCLWAVGLPLSYILSHAVGWGLPGIYYGFCTGIFILGPFLVWHSVTRWDWPALVERAVKAKEETQCDAHEEPDTEDKRIEQEDEDSEMADNVCPSETTQHAASAQDTVVVTHIVHNGDVQGDDNANKPPHRVRNDC